MLNDSQGFWPDCPETIIYNFSKHDLGIIARLAIKDALVILMLYWLISWSLSGVDAVKVFL